MRRRPDTKRGQRLHPVAVKITRVPCETHKDVKVLVLTGKELTTVYK